MYDPGRGRDDFEEVEDQVKILDVSETLDASRDNNQGNWKILL